MVHTYHANVKLLANDDGGTAIDWAAATPSLVESQAMLGY